MSNLSCRTALGWLTPFHDGELPSSKRRAVWQHLEECPACMAEALRLQTLRDAVHQAAGAPVELLDGFQERVIGRWKAEKQASLRSTLAAQFQDFHLVWAGTAAVAVALVCFVLAGHLVRARVSAPDSLAALLRTPILTLQMAGEEVMPLDGSFVLPRIRPAADDVRVAGLNDQVITLAALVTRDGRVANLEVLRAHDLNRREIGGLVHAAATARFQPARRAGTPVAVNMVWLLAHTTVRGKIAS